MKFRVINQTEFRSFKNESENENTKDGIVPTFGVRTCNCVIVRRHVTPNCDWSRHLDMDDPFVLFKDPALAKRLAKSEIM